VNDLAFFLAATRDSPILQPLIQRAPTDLSNASIATAAYSCPLTSTQC